MTSLDDALTGLAKSAAIVFLGSVIGRLLGLLGQVLVIRALNPTSFGHVALAYTVVSTVGGLSLLGVHEGVTRLMSAEEIVDYRRRVLRSGYMFAILGAVIIATALYLARFRLGTYLNDDRLPELLIAFLPFLLVHTLSRISFGALRVYKRSLAAVIARDLGPKVGAILLFGLFALSGEAFFGAIVYWVVTPAIMALLTGYYLHRELSMGRVVGNLPDSGTIRELWSFSWPLALGSSFFLLLGNVDVLMIGYFMEPRSVGLYRAIQPLNQVTTFVLVAFTFLFLPIATEYYNDRNLDALDQFYTISTKWIIAATFPPVLVFVLFAPDVVQVFFGSEYVPAAPALAVLTGGLFIRAIVGLNGDMTKAIDRPRIELYAVAPAVAINIALNIVLIPRYGIVGAAMATVVGYGVYNSLEVIAIYLTVGSHPFSADSVKPLVPTLLFAVGLLRLTANITLSLPLLLATGVLISVVHLLSIVLTRSLSRADLVLFEQFEEHIGIDLAWLKSFMRSHY